METKFTKGEWIITTPTSKSDPQRIATTAIQENPNKVPYICDMWGIATEEGEANANLLSAAPELFEACERALQVFDEEHIYGQARLLIVAAMRKALGKCSGFS